MVHLVQKYWADNRGASAVEFAILTPVFLLMLMGMIAYGIYFGASLSLQQLAADAARTSIAGSEKSEREGLVLKFLDNNASQYMLIDGKAVVSKFEDVPKDPNQFRFTLSYNAMELPIWNLYLPLPLPSQSIVHQATIRNGGI